MPSQYIIFTQIFYIISTHTLSCKHHGPQNLCVTNRLLFHILINNIYRIIFVADTGNRVLANKGWRKKYFH